MAKKIAIIIERTDTSLGGAERSVNELAEALEEIGNKVSIIAATGKKINSNTHILFPDKSGRTSFPEFEAALKTFFSENRYDIIHSVLPFEFADIYQPRGGSYKEAALRNAASYENRLKAHYKKITLFLNFRRTILQKAEQRICENPTGPIVAALSGYVAEQFKQHYHINSDRIAVICNGVKTGKINFDRVSELRKQISNNTNFNNSILFLFPANNFRLKGLGFLIKAMTQSHKNVFLAVVGRGNSSAYRNLAEKTGVNNKTIFLNQLSDIENLIYLADVIVLPTFYDPSSRVVLEALAAAKPVITTSFNGATDLFTNGRHGIVIDSPDNTYALAQAINYFSNRENIQKAQNAIISDDLKNKVSIKRVAQETDALYDKILERRRNK